jgi:hypothetical protein
MGSIFTVGGGNEATVIAATLRLTRRRIRVSRDNESRSDVFLEYSVVDVVVNERPEGMGVNESARRVPPVDGTPNRGRMISGLPSLRCSRKKADLSNT